MEAGLVLHLQDPKENMDGNINFHFCFLSFQFNLTPCLTFYFRSPCCILLLLDKKMLFGKKKWFSSYMFRNKEIFAALLEISSVGLM